MGIDARILVRVKGSPSDENLKRWSWYICEAFGANKFWRTPVARSGDYDHKIPDGKIYRQDGPAIIAEAGETLLEVSVSTRYYGEGYTRGDIITICAVAEWIEQNVPNCEVWYGGDSSGVCAEPFPDDVRRQHRKLLYSQEGSDYYKGRGPLATNDIPPFAACERCIPERKPNRYGFGTDYAAYECPGCGKREQTRDGGKTWNKAEV